MAGRECDDLWMDNEEKLLSTNIEEIQNAFRRYRHIIKTTQQELKERQDEVRDLKNRLSVMASERMSVHNPCVEDLSDPLRPTALAASWESLFRSGAYWAAYEALSTGSGKEDAGQLLYSVTKTVYHVCVRTVEDAVTAATTFPARALLERGHLESSVARPLEWNWDRGRQMADFFSGDRKLSDDLKTCMTSACRQRLEDDINSQTGLMRSTLLRFLKSRPPPQSLGKKVDYALRGMSLPDTPEVRGFVSELQRLCFFMRVQDIPLEVDLSHDVGSAFDPHLFDLESSVAGNATGAAIHCILRPPLLRSRDGPVLVRGEAEVQAATHPGVSPTPVSQAAATEQCVSPTPEPQEAATDPGVSSTPAPQAAATDPGVSPTPAPQAAATQADKSQKSHVSYASFQVTGNTVDLKLEAPKTQGHSKDAVENTGSHTQPAMESSERELDSQNLGSGSSGEGGMENECQNSQQSEDEEYTVVETTEEYIIIDGKLERPGDLESEASASGSVGR